MRNTENMRIVLVDDHAVFRQGLRGLIAQQTDMDVVGEAANGRDALLQVEQLIPDVVIMDVGMPGLNGVEASHQILKRHPGVKIVALSMHADRTSVLNMLNAGVLGYVEKNCAFEDLIQAIRAAVLNKQYLSSRINQMMLEYFEDHGTDFDATPASELTGRQREVLQLMAEGKSTREIASTLYVSIKTVEAHRQHIMAKLDLHTLADLIKYAIRKGVTSLEN